MAAEEAEQQTTLRSLEQIRRQAAEAEAAAATEQQQLQEQVGSLFTLCIWSTAQNYTENAPLLSQEDQPPACFPGRGLSECLPAVSQCSVIHADTFVLTPLSNGSLHSTVAACCRQRRRLRWQVYCWAERQPSLVPWRCRTVYARRRQDYARRSSRRRRASR